MSLLGNKLHDGRFLDGLIHWGPSLSTKSQLVRGYYADVPDMTGASTQALNDYYHNWRNFLFQLGADYTFDVQWEVSGNFKPELDYGAQLTEDKAVNDFSYFIRRERNERARDSMARGRLRRPRQAFFISTRANTLSKVGIRTVRGLDEFIEQVRRGFDQKMEMMARQFPDLDLTPMNDAEHGDFMLRFLNPAMTASTNTLEENVGGFNWTDSILQNCLNGPMPTTTTSDGTLCFKLDDHYHSMFVLRRWPQNAAPVSTMGSLTHALSLLNYRITQRFEPIDIELEVKKTENRLNRLLAESSRKPSHRAAIERDEKKMYELQKGFAIPFNVLTILRVWDRTLDGLADKSQVIKGAIKGMGGAQYHQCDLATQSFNLFNASMPGHPSRKVRQWFIYGENQYLANLVVSSNAYTGSLGEGEIMFDGVSDNLVGISTFSGDTPRHAVLVGATGAGKSVFMIDVLAQSEPFYDFTCIIEEGLSYGTYTKTLGGQPIIIHPDSDITLNYLDTLGAPLSQSHLSSAAGLCLKMVGSSGDQSKDKYRASVMGHYISLLYNDAAQDWLGTNESEVDDLAREAHLTELYRRRFMRPGSTMTDAYFELREMRGTPEVEATNPEGYQQLLAASRKDIPDGEPMTAFAKGMAGQSLLQSLVFTRFKSEDYADRLTHSSLVTLMKLDRDESHSVEDMSYLVTMLSAWQSLTETGAKGKNGILFDGITNLRVDGKIAHFELGSIPSTAKELKEAAGFLVANYVRNRIVAMPRAKHKRVIFEEVARFLDVPGGEEIVSEFYAQLRKYACWVCSVTQQYQQFAGKPLCKTIFNNARMFFLMAQNSAEEVADLARQIGLPDTLQRTVLEFPMPDDKAGKKRRPVGGSAGMAREPSRVLIASKEGKRLQCGVIKNVASAEMLYVAKSDGEHFDKREKALALYDNVFEGIIAETIRERAEAATPRPRAA